CRNDLRDEFCLLCNSRNSCAYDPNPNSFDSPPDSYQPPHPTYETYSCESCGNDSHFGYDCPPQFPLNYEPKPGYIRNYNSYPHDSSSFSQQYLCCENCGGPHENFQCQPMNQNFYEPNLCYNSISFDFDQFQPPQFPVIYQPPQETSVKILHDQENIINSVQTFLRKFNRYSFFETPKVLLLAWDRVFEIKDTFRNKQYKPDAIQKLFRKLFNDVQNIHEELAEYINTLSWNRPAFYNNDKDDDEEFSIPMSEIHKSSLTATTLDSPKTDSLIMVDKHLDTIPKTKSDEFIKSSVENLVQNPSESEDECECDVPDCDDSQTTKFSTFYNPLFDDSTSSDDDEFNPIHNEDLDSTLKNDRFDTGSYLHVLNRDTLMASSPKIDSLLDEFAGELITIAPRIVNREHEEYISVMERLLYDNSSPRPPKDFHANLNTIIESLPTFPIPVEDSDPFIEEIDLFLASDGSIPPGIDGDYSNSEGHNIFLERLLYDDPINFPNILDFSNDVRVFLPFFTYPVTSSILLSSRSEDTIFDPGISNYHFSSLESGVSHRSGTFMKFNVYPNHLNESPMEILSSICFPMDR
nr:hypothetical protein [Tanacetum cinerariifolium]